MTAKYWVVKTESGYALAGTLQTVPRGRATQFTNLKRARAYGTILSGKVFRVQPKSDAELVYDYEVSIKRDDP